MLKDTDTKDVEKTGLLPFIKEIIGKSGPLIALIVLCIILTIKTPNFLTVR